MKRNYLFIFLHFIYLTSAAQLNLNWANRSGSSPFAYCSGNATAIDATGNVYTTGVFRNTVDFDPGPGVFNLIDNPGSGDVFVCKFSASGALIWARQLGGVNQDNSYSIALDALGNVYTTGSFNGVGDFDPGPGTFSISTVGMEDIFISKLDASGNFIWVKSLSGVFDDYGYSISVDAQGNVYTTGKYWGGDFDPGPGVFTLVSSGGQDVFVSKLDVSGNFVWAKHFGGPNDDRGFSITTDGKGNVYTTGSYNGLTDFDPGPGVYNLNGGSSYDIFISKLDSNGSFVWAKSFGGPTADAGYSIVVDSIGNVYTTGCFSDAGADFDPGPAWYYLPYTGLGSTEIFISKLDSNGVFMWAKSMGGIGPDCGKALALDASGNIYTSGMFSSPADFDPGPAVYSLSPVAGSSIFISKLASNGSFIWATSISGNGNPCAGYSIDVDAANNIYVGGYLSGIVDFDPGPGIYNSANIGSEDIFVVKYCQMALPTVTASSTTSFCPGGSVILTSSSANSYSWSTGATTQSILVSSPSNYTNMVSNGAGCSAIIIIPVIVYPSPTISVNSGSICLGNSFTIMPNGAGTYTISGGSSVISPTISSSYSITGTSTAGCVSLLPAISNVTVNALPLPTITVNSGSICAGNSFTIVAGGANTYTFSSGSPIVTPSISSSYSVVGTNSAGCISVGPAVSNITVFALPLPTITVNSGSICAGNSFTIVPLGANTYTLQGGNLIVSPIVNTSYTVVGKDALGCISNNYATSSITVNQNPTITVNSGSVCSGNSFTIVPLGANTYTFQGGNAVVNPTTNSSYTVVGSSIAGCTSSIFATSNIVVNSLPQLNTASSSSLICFGQTAILTVNGATTYTWNTGPTSNTIAVTPTSTTNYTVTGANLNGCLNSSIITQNVSLCTDLFQITNNYDNEIIVYPNPFNNKINIIFNGTQQTVQVFNALGSSIYNSIVCEEKTEIDFSQQPNGIYFIRIGHIMKKLIKE